MTSMNSAPIAGQGFAVVGRRRADTTVGSIFGRTSNSPSCSIWDLSWIFPSCQTKNSRFVGWLIFLIKSTIRPSGRTENSVSRVTAVAVSLCWVDPIAAPDCRLGKTFCEPCSSWFAPLGFAIITYEVRGLPSVRHRPGSMQPGIQNLFWGARTWRAGHIQPLE